MDITELIREYIQYVIRIGIGAVLFLILILMFMYVVDRAYDKTSQATRKSRVLAAIWCFLHSARVITVITCFVALAVCLLMLIIYIVFGGEFYNPECY